MKSNGKRDRGSNHLLSRYLQEVSLPLAQAGDLDQLIDRCGDARFVLLGEASHGTSDYYTWRARITVGVEGDWPECYTANHYLKGYAEAGETASGNQRLPIGLQ